MFEIAHQLELENQKLSFLGIVDSEGFYSKKFFHSNKLRLEVYIFFKLPVSLKIKYISNRLLKRFYNSLKTKFLNGEVNKEIKKKNPRESETDYLKLWFNYHTNYKLNSDVHLIKGVQEESDNLLYYIKCLQPDLYFGNNVNGKLIIEEIDCSHMGFFKSPHLIELTDKIVAVLGQT